MMFKKRSITTHKGWQVPTGCHRRLDRQIKSVELMERALVHCKDTRTVVQAGGNMGVWPVWLANKFQHVVTFEPEKLNYTCMVENVKSYSNIKYHHAALGAKEGTARLQITNSNLSHHLTEDPGDTKVMKIDGLNLEYCDYIMLDVEGYEYEALLGGIETIREFLPVLQFEEKGHGVLKGTGKTIDDILKILPPEYGEVARAKSDRIMIARYI